MSSQHFNPHICTYIHIQTLTTTWHPHLLNELTSLRHFPIHSPYILSKKINTTKDNLKSIFFKVRPGLATDCPKVSTLTDLRPMVKWDHLRRRDIPRDKPGYFVKQESSFHRNRSVLSWIGLSDLLSSCSGRLQIFQTSRDRSLYKAVWSALTKGGIKGK